MMNPAPLVNMTGIGVGVIPWILMSGTLVLHHPFDATTYFKQLVQEKVNFTLAVPAVAMGMLKHPDVDKFDLSSVKHFAQGSSRPSLWAFKEFKRRWEIESINVWEQNEGTGLFSTSEVMPNLEKRADTFPWSRNGNYSEIPFFSAIETKIADTSTCVEMTKPGDVGELCYRSL
ncbi:MAG: AMP-binding protein [Thermoplasmataceae archaeon]